MELKYSSGDGSCVLVYELSRAVEARRPRYAAAERVGACLIVFFPPFCMILAGMWIADHFPKGYASLAFLVCSIAYFVAFWRGRIWN